MKIIMGTFFLSLLSCCAFGQDKAAIAAAEAGCGSDDVEFSVTTDESKHPTPAPENGKALIYLVQNGGTFKFGADGEWLGALKGGTYFYASVEPGEHHLCVKGSRALYKYVALTDSMRRQARPTTSLFAWCRAVTPSCSLPKWTRTKEKS